MKREQFQDRFHYSLSMENTNHEFKGIKKCSSGMASAYANLLYVKKAYQTWLKLIYKRIEEVVTTDELLRMTLISDVEALQAEVAEIKRNSDNDLEIIASLFRLIAHLLGWDYLNGRFYRTPMFHQTTKQRTECLMYAAQTSLLPQGLFEVYHRRRLLKQLLSEGLSYARIALILGTSLESVKTLEKAEHVDKIYKEIEREKS